MVQKKKQTEQVSKTRSITYVKKLSMANYQLRKLTLDGDNVIKDEVIKDDLPNIVVGYMLLAIQNGEFENGAS